MLVIKYADALLVKEFGVRPEDISFRKSTGITTLALDLQMITCEAQLLLHFEAGQALAIFKVNDDVEIIVAKVDTPDELRAKYTDTGDMFTYHKIQSHNVEALKAELVKFCQMFGAIACLPVAELS